jgi:cellulose synthase/poly-beta-1,6-N-acetylglucosamine synthase-like glycosyltransferase
MINETIRAAAHVRLPQLDLCPSCSIVIPCLNEELYIEPVVRAAMEQEYPREKLEILVADGGSTDRTRAIVAALAAEDPRVRLVDNPGRFPSAGMNEGIKRSRGAVIVRMDAHAEYALDYVRASVDALRRTGAANVGGAARPRHKGRFQQALCVALGSRLGMGGAAFRDPDREGFVDTVFNGAFRREVFEQIGLFDASARTNEDAEMNQRIIESGGRVFLSREVVAYYYPRASLHALARQYFSYGKGRARTLLRHGRLLSPRPVIPFMTVSTFAVLGALSLAVPASAPLLHTAALVYGAAIVAESARLAAHAELRLLPLFVAIFPAMHAAHGAGFAAGLWANAGARLDRRDPDLLVAR